VGSTTTLYVTDADNREVLEYDGSSGALERWYAFGRGPDAVLGQMNIAPDTRETMIPDIQGSIIGTLDSGSGALAKSGYQSFGENPTLTSGTFRYTARRFDPETAGSTSQPSGLYYYRARMYSPTWGRFLQPDPIGYAAGPNLYAYVGNDPLNGTDPNGTDPFIGATVGGIAGAYYGVVGAITAGGSAREVIVAGLVGGATGAAVGLIDRTLGVATLAVIGGAAAGGGDVLGQEIVNISEGKSLGNVNLGSTAGAVLGGALGGAGGAALAGIGMAAGFSELASTAGAAAITGGPGALLPGVGAAIVNNVSPAPTSGSTEK
jgi:RHS repeat-associated protein